MASLVFQRHPALISNRTRSPAGQEMMIHAAFDESSGTSPTVSPVRRC